jgi:hypothetical protein
MKWLPSFAKLFLLAVLGLMLGVAGGIGSVASSGNYTASSVFMTVELLGWLLVMIASILLLLKFFMRLDQKA